MHTGIVYTIVVTYNGMTWIEKCLSSLQNSSFATRIVVIDNCSSDNTVHFIKQNYPQVQLIQSQANLGFGRGNNIGLEIALANHCDHVFLLNQDAWVEKDTIEQLVNAQTEQPQFGILSPVHLNGKGSNLDEDFYLFLKKANTNGLLYDALLAKSNSNAFITTPFVNAAAWLINANCLRETGGFDPIFFHYGEDDNYAQRVIYKGFRSGIFIPARIFHDKERPVTVQQPTLLKLIEKEWKEFIIHACNPLKTDYKRFVVRRFFRHLIQCIINIAKLKRFEMMFNLSMAKRIIFKFSDIKESRAESMQSIHIPHLGKKEAKNPFTLILERHTAKKYPSSNPLKV
jgi:GT2 family glycosyltransferase